MAANANKPKYLTLPAEPDTANCYGAQNTARIAEALSAGRAVMPPAGAAPADYVGMPRPQSETAPDLEMTPPPDKKAARQRVNREAAEQITYMDHVRACCHPESALIAALANENAAGKSIGVLRWKMGVQAGLPDIAVFVPRRIGSVDYHGLMIEMKCSDGVMSDVRDTQRAWHDALDAQGYKVVVAFGWRRAWATTVTYLGWKDDPFYEGRALREQDAGDK